VSSTPFSHAQSLRIGTVDFVSPDEIKVLLDIEAPESVALNTGGVRPFPRVNGYVLVPVDDGYLVGQIESLTIERSSFPKRSGVKDFGVVDLPYPLRKLSLNPLGTLRKQAGPGENYVFRRGADALPSVGYAVFLPTNQQLRSIVESGTRRRVRVGTSPLADGAEVAINPDKLFGRHLAVLGNTGSGKSCSVAGLIRWSLAAAANNLSPEQSQGPNARFIILDPNGEYSRAFSDNENGPGARIFKVSPEEGELALQVPLWFWNSAEWASFTQATAKTQKPLLRRALREIKAGRTMYDDPSAEEKKLDYRRYLSSCLIGVQRDLRSGAIRTESNKFGYYLRAINDDLAVKQSDFSDVDVGSVRVAITAALESTFNSFIDKSTNSVVEHYRAFTESHITAVISSLTEVINSLGGIIYQDGPDEDVPLPFDGGELADHLQILAAQENVSQFLDYLVSRIRMFLADSKISAVVGGKEGISLAEWLSQYIGDDAKLDKPIAILDLSLVPTEVVHVVTAVTARVVFESLQRYRKKHGETLPTVLVMEEAHTFVKRYKDDLDNQEAATICCQVFERIAREGRKFGLGLVLSSQRPSELSPTVLSQCNTFLLHRISNDRDQELVRRLVPDNLRGLLRELPSLPSQHAVLLGWATELPVMVRMDDLPKKQQPHSDDPDFWDVWTGQNEKGEEVRRTMDWAPIATEWQSGANIEEVDDE